MNSSRNKKITEYRAVVFDLDGTLYFQRKLRLTMACRLAFYYLCHPFHIKELLVLKEFRTVREHWDELSKRAEDRQNMNLKSPRSLDTAQYLYVAEKMHVKAETVEQVVQTWIYENPLSALQKSRDEAIAELIKKLKEKNLFVLIFSDYPVKEKLSALGLITLADGMYSAVDERLMELKPSPKGLKLIMEDFHLEASQILMVGDRFSKDGMSAVNAGTDYLILGKTKASRSVVYDKLFREF